MGNMLKFVIVAAIFGISNGAKVTFFENSNFEGEQHSMDFEGLACYNLPGHFNDKASSVSTHENCLIAFEHSDCKGKKEVIAPGTASHGQLADFDFNDAISSFRQCAPNGHTCRQVTVDVDTSEAPDLYNFGQRVKYTMQQWYPFVCRLLYSPTYEEVGKINLKFDPNHGGVAGADAFGKIITGSANYYRDHPNDIGSMIHEMGHIIQQYKSGCDWITEGIADSARRWHFESPRPEKPDSSVTFPNAPVYFLNWIEGRWPNTLYWINKECREGNYDVKMWQLLTGKKPEELWEQMMRE